MIPLAIFPEIPEGYFGEEHRKSELMKAIWEGKNAEDEGEEAYREHLDIRP